ncbi:flavin reductase family protein [Actinophytocola oryzae]|uniref:Flavin reductase ActVB n=1 Tax=Actinophytocola oryzae TaxID=502181 RepID=A0A4R7VS21_9PSEU|nr:flavin reductase family protein [Actinophytocola oryzae]TDV52265.1 flavin reductase ActVB [Actinophytocola oryzae]
MITTATVYPISTRQAMTRWPTGVAILTTADREGWWWGCTVSSVASVSTAPPIVAVSIPRETAGRQTFTSADAVAIHVLREGQQALAEHFATSPTDFDTVQSTHGIPIECGFESVPLLGDVTTRLECRPVNTVAAGTNVLLLAEIVRARTGPGDPLIHVGDDYRHLARPA